MIVTPFSSKLLIKDYNMSEEWTNDLIFTLQFLSLQKDDNCTFSHALENSDLSVLYQYDGHKSTKPYVIHEESARQFKVIKELRDIFIEGFCELNKSYGNQYTEKYLRDVYVKDSGNFAVIKQGQRVGLHNHPSIAFAIFYLTDVDNHNDGGELVLYDPSFHQNTHYYSKKEIRIQTKKNRLVIGPANMWHEVTPYTGVTDRMCAVIDLKR